MRLPKFISLLAMLIGAAIGFGYGSTYLKIRERDQMATELAQWQLDEWKENLLAERKREFFERSGQ